jgi:hypothetical protein
MPDRTGDDEKRAASGVARFLRTWLPRLVVAGVAGVFVWAALRGSDGAGGSGGESSSDRTTASEEAAAGGEGGDEGAAGSGDTSPPDVPVDVDEERPAVDLSQPPDSADPLDVARWWAATYVRYSGAEPPAALVERLAGVITPDLEAQLTAEPPAASYDAPIEIVGASVSEGPAPTGGGAGTGARSVARATVETPGALLVYEVTLAQDAAGAWRVAEATPV